MGEWLRRRRRLREESGATSTVQRPPEGLAIATCVICVAGKALAQPGRKVCHLPLMVPSNKAGMRFDTILILSGSNVSPAEA